tara:strand:- start:521 stop:697 length:177 start_codon:yes stop_codon:yes gene_type:complete
MTEATGKMIMRLENRAIAGDYNKVVLQTYVVDGERWALLQGYTREDLRILKEALEQVK